MVWAKTEYRNAKTVVRLIKAYLTPRCFRTHATTVAFLNSSQSHHGGVRQLACWLSRSSLPAVGKGNRTQICMVWQVVAGAQADVYNPESKASVEGTDTRESGPAPCLGTRARGLTDHMLGERGRLVRE